MRMEILNNSTEINPLKRGMVGERGREEMRVRRNKKL